ncbi:alpha/beta hydrolase-fold protein [Siphonobacter sp. SORGH_AS_1065]|uniref:alpha/beta hydrolase-fold protein n=1 Tax=Siphonobacter sp. SORGH_AS_1065 TaxID=3041795 RepID=UPI002789F0EA|nr:alpha/beta hydrolase-fold protein [Siphonobacter sp. SORGH_AS_1065]MDQ1085525.1 putative alpha/beta superfamily hydrolase [Siphonobacter sp. SORGH_AS_1065]
MEKRWVLFWVGIFLQGLTASSQVLISGRIIDAERLTPLAWVHVTHHSSRLITQSLENGQFTLSLPSSSSNDTLLFSLVGYRERRLPVQELLRTRSSTIITLEEQSTILKSVHIRQSKLKERTFGIRKRSPLIHFTDGMFKATDSVEIGQVIMLGQDQSPITSLQLYVTESRKDSASFRIRFYRIKQNQPTDLLWESSVFRRGPIQEGWLRFDLQSANLTLNGTFLAVLELIPEPGSAALKPLSYEIKLGGRSKSFYRKKNSDIWHTPPHHYCLSVTALVNPSLQETEVPETIPVFSLFSKAVADTFHLFVRLPPSYPRSPKRSYPVIYLLDANAYFDQVSELSSSSIPESILVGIGYKDAYLMDSLRIRDYTYPAAPASDSLMLSGGAERFYTFLTTELIPEIDRRYRSIPTNRTLMGHSFGGYFTLYALHKESLGTFVFRNFIAASPSLTYADGYLPQVFRLSSPSTNHFVFLTLGETEGSSATFKDFSEILHKHSTLQIQSKIYPRLDHMGTVLPSFQEGLQLIEK